MSRNGTYPERMVRRSKLLIASVVVLASAAIGLAYTGTLASFVAPEQLPGSPVVGMGAILALVVLGLLSSVYLDRKAWREMGEQAGLTVGGGSRFADGPPQESDRATLEGIVDGRPVRARTYSTGGGQTGSSRTYTVVEAELGSPVEWHASFGTPNPDRAPKDPGIDAAKTRTVDGVGVRGEVSDEIARAVLTPAVRDALSAVEGEVAVGDVKENFVGDVLDELDDADGGLAGTFAEGVLRSTTEVEEGPSRVVGHRDRGLLTDGTELQRRIDAVTAVADAVDRL